MREFLRGEDDVVSQTLHNVVAYSPAADSGYRGRIKSATAVTMDPTSSVSFAPQFISRRQLLSRSSALSRLEAPATLRVVAPCGSFLPSYPMFGAFCSVVAAPRDVVAQPCSLGRRTLCGGWGLEVMHCRPTMRRLCCSLADLTLFVCISAAMDAGQLPTPQNHATANSVAPQSTIGLRPATSGEGALDKPRCQAFHDVELWFGLPDHLQFSSPHRASRTRESTSLADGSTLYRLRSKSGSKNWCYVRKLERKMDELTASRIFAKWAKETRPSVGVYTTDMLLVLYYSRDDKGSMLPIHPFLRATFAIKSFRVESGLVKIKLQDGRKYVVKEFGTKAYNAWRAKVSSNRSCTNMLTDAKELSTLIRTTLLLIPDCYVPVKQLAEQSSVIQLRILLKRVLQQIKHQEDAGVILPTLKLESLFVRRHVANGNLDVVLLPEEIRKRAHARPPGRFKAPNAWPRTALLNKLLRWIVQCAVATESTCPQEQTILRRLNHLRSSLFNRVGTVEKCLEHPLFKGSVVSGAPPDSTASSHHEASSVHNENRRPHANMHGDHGRARDGGTADGSQGHRSPLSGAAEVTDPTATFVSQDLDPHKELCKILESEDVSSGHVPPVNHYFDPFDETWHFSQDGANV